MDLHIFLPELWKQRYRIISFAFAPLLLYVLISVFIAKVDNNYYLNTVIKLNREFSSLKPSSIIAENIIQESLKAENIEVPSEDIVDLFSVTQGNDVVNEELDGLMRKMTGEIAPARQENMAEIMGRYENLIGAQKTFFTIHYNLYKSPLNRETAKRLVERMISTYNEKFAAGLILNEPVLNEIDSSDFQLFEQVNSYSLYNFTGLISSLEAKNNQLVAVKFSKNGFNPAVIGNRLNALDFGIRQIINSSTDYNTFFLDIIDRDLNVVNKQIKTITQALEEISREQKRTAGFSMGSSSNEGKLSAEYNSALLDRFLNLGATLSLVEYQQELLKEKINLEFRRTNLEQRKIEYSKNIKRASANITPFPILLQELKTVSDQMNAFIRSYNSDFQRQVVSVLKISVENPGRIVRPILFAMILACSMGLTLMGYFVWFSLQESAIVEEGRNQSTKEDARSKR
jgi:hypothetical protein